MMITAEMLNITETTPTIAIFWSRPIFFFRAKIRVSSRQPRLNPIRNRLPVVL